MNIKLSKLEMSHSVSPHIIGVDKDGNRLETNDELTYYISENLPLEEQRIIKWLISLGIEMKDPYEKQEEYYLRHSFRAKSNGCLLSLDKGSPLLMKRKQTGSSIDKSKITVNSEENDDDAKRTRIVSFDENGKLF